MLYPNNCSLFIFMYRSHLQQSRHKRVVVCCRKEGLTSISEVVGADVKKDTSWWKTGGQYLTETLLHLLMTSLKAFKIKNILCACRKKSLLSWCCSFLYSRTPDERPPSPTTIPLIRPHFVWRTGHSVCIRIPHERPSLLYDHTNVILRVVV